MPAKNDRVTKDLKDLDTFFFALVALRSFKLTISNSHEWWREFHGRETTVNFAINFHPWDEILYIH